MPQRSAIAKSALVLVFSTIAIYLAIVGGEIVAILSAFLAIHFLRSGSMRPFGMDAANPVLQLVLAGLFCLMYIVIIWLPFAVFGQIPFATFLSEYWLIPLCYVAYAFSVVWRLCRRADETWKILQSNYSSEFESPTRPTLYAFTYGLVSFSEEAFCVTTMIAHSGVVFLKSARSFAHIPWDRVHSISRSSRNGGNTATLALKRRIGPPFCVVVPWVAAFDSLLPDRLRQTLLDEAVPSPAAPAATAASAAAHELTVS